VTEAATEAIAEPARPPGPPTGIVEGIVVLAEGTELPSYPDTRGPVQPQIPESCTPPQLLDRQPVRSPDGRGLEGVLVQAAEFDAEMTREPATHEVVIRDCRLVPRLVAAVRGDTLRVKNETDYPFLPTLGRSPMMQAIMKDETRDFALDTGGVFSLTCGFAAPCGRTDVVVVYHPVHAVTDEAGRFRIENVPAGEEVEIHAWHPLFEDSMVTVTVAAGATETLELTLRPVPPPAPAPTPTPGETPAEAPAENQPGLF
jgi:hypothetical protein